MRCETRVRETCGRYNLHVCCFRSTSILCATSDSFRASYTLSPPSQNVGGASNCFSSRPAPAAAPAAADGRPSAFQWRSLCSRACTVSKLQSWRAAAVPLPGVLAAQLLRGHGCCRDSSRRRGSTYHQLRPSTHTTCSCRHHITAHLVLQGVPTGVMGACCEGVCAGMNLPVLVVVFQLPRPAV